MEAKVWDSMIGKELFSLRGHDGPVTRVAFSPDGRRLASGSDDNTMKIWDIATGKLQELFSLKGHDSFVQGVTFSPDGRRLASGSWDEAVKIWDSATGRELLSLNAGAGRVTSVEFSPDRQHLASTHAYPGSISDLVLATSLCPSPYAS